MRKETFLVNNQQYLLKIHFEERDNTHVSFSAKNINIRIPLNLSREEQFRQILQMKQWAAKKIQENPARYSRPEPRVYHSGEKLSVGEQEYLLNIAYSEKQSSSARLENNTIFLNVASQLPEEIKQKHISSLLSRVIARQRLPGLYGQIKQLNELHFQRPLKKIFFKNMRSSWGSCSSQGNLNISTRLLFAPEKVLRYICIHELTHLIEFNHSERFWELVGKAMANYKEQEQWLKENGAELRF